MLSDSHKHSMKMITPSHFRMLIKPLNIATFSYSSAIEIPDFLPELRSLYKKQIGTKLSI